MKKFVEAGGNFQGPWDINLPQDIRSRETYDSFKEPQEIFNVFEENKENI